MLVLTRKLNQTVIIGDNIKITVVEIEGDKVKLGVEAPRDIPVHRWEIYHAVRQENARSAGTDAGMLQGLEEILPLPDGYNKD